MISAHALAMTGARDADVTRSERPNLCVSMARRTIGLEVAEVTVSARFTNAFTELNAEINDAIDHGPTLRLPSTYLHFSTGSDTSDQCLVERCASRFLAELLEAITRSSAFWHIHRHAILAYVAFRPRPTKRSQRTH